MLRRQAPDKSAKVIVPKQFVKDFYDLAQFYNWRDEEQDEMRALARRDPALRDYLMTLAMAHRLGYRQHAGNGYVRLNVWLAINGYQPVTINTQGEGT